MSISDPTKEDMQDQGRPTHRQPGPTCTVSSTFNFAVGAAALAAAAALAWAAWSWLAG